nr:sigma factor [uncultured Clostridium sp.]
MNTGLFSNEELVKLYRESRNESYLQELITQNKGLISLLVKDYLTSIPNSEMEDLISEAYIPMLRAIEEFEPERGIRFSTLLKVYVQQHLNRLYKEATRQKRHNGSIPASYEELVEINKEGGTEADSNFTVDCEDINSVEFMTLLSSLGLNEKEQVAVDVLMAGGSKGEVAKALRCTPATANYYFKSIRKKFVFAGVAV